MQDRLAALGKLSDHLPQFNTGARVQTSTEVLQAASRLANARSREARALADYQIALVEIAFDRTRGSYPGSLMGSVALVRQTLADASWDAARGTDASGPDSALGALHRTPATMFATRDELDALRAYLEFRALPDAAQDTPDKEKP